jgi:hypothetical protein
MAQATEPAIGARPATRWCCGGMSRLTVDPAARTVTHLVIEPKHRQETHRLFPLHLVKARHHVSRHRRVDNGGRLAPRPGRIADEPQAVLPLFHLARLREGHWLADGRFGLPRSRHRHGGGSRSV